MAERAASCGVAPNDLDELEQADRKATANIREASRSRARRTMQKPTDLLRKQNETARYKVSSAAIF
jgi:hypothetical protein